MRYSINEYVRKRMEILHSQQAKLWEQYVTAASNAIYMLMDRKITRDVSEYQHLEPVIISPYANNNLEDSKHGAIYINPIQLRRNVVSSTFEERYNKVIHTPFKCSFIQEAYYAVFCSAFALLKLTGYSSGTKLQDNQNKALVFSMYARKAIFNAVHESFMIASCPMVMYYALYDADGDPETDLTKREIAENVLISDMEMMINPLYVDGTYGGWKISPNDIRCLTAEQSCWQDILPKDFLTRENIFHDIKDIRGYIRQ